MVKYASIEDARKAVESWDGDPQSVKHLGNSGNSVFSFKNNSRNELQILRFTDPDFRAFNNVLAEISFLNHLHNDGVPVANAKQNLDGKYATITSCSTGELICSSISFAHGIEVQDGSPYWSEKFFFEWGRNLALIHRSSAKFKPTPSEPRRWQWQDEILIENALKLIPKNDTKSFIEFNEVMAHCHAISKVSDQIGLIHADHAPQNFRYEPERNIITSFDFGNCCYHWFIADLAISLSTVRRKRNREQIKENILKGYCSILELPQNFEELINIFIRLRVLYLYLSRLHFWSGRKTNEQIQELELIRSRVHTKVGWS